MSNRLCSALVALALAVVGARAADPKATSAIDAIPPSAASVIVANGPFSARPCSDSARAIDTFRCATLAPLTQLSATIERRLSRDQLAWSLLALSEAWSADLAGAPPPDEDSAIVEFPGGLGLACLQPEACSVRRLTRGDAAEHGRIGELETWTMKSAKPGTRLPVLLANPRPGILVAAYSKTFLEEIAQKLSTHDQTSASIPEMHHVKTDSPVWGARPSDHPRGGSPTQAVKSKAKATPITPAPTKLTRQPKVCMAQAPPVSAPTTPKAAPTATSAIAPERRSGFT